MASSNKYLLALTVLAAGTYGAAHAQSPSMIPIPFVSAAVGLPNGTANSLCSSGILNGSGVNLGDGCIPTQAKLSEPWDVKVDNYGDVYITENAGTNYDIRVVYNGSPALATLLVAASPNISNFTPVVGRIYTLGNLCAGL